MMTSTKSFLQISGSPDSSPTKPFKRLSEHSYVVLLGGSVRREEKGEEGQRTVRKGKERVRGRGG